MKTIEVFLPLFLLFPGILGNLLGSTGGHHAHGDHDHGHGHHGGHNHVTEDHDHQHGGHDIDLMLGPLLGLGHGHGGHGGHHGGDVSLDHIFKELGIKVLGKDQENAEDPGPIEDLPIPDNKILIQALLSPTTQPITLIPRTTTQRPATSTETLPVKAHGWEGQNLSPVALIPHNRFLEPVFDKSLLVPPEDQQHLSLDYHDHNPNTLETTLSEPELEPDPAFLPNQLELDHKPRIPPVDTRWTNFKLVNVPVKSNRVSDEPRRPRTRFGKFDSTNENQRPGLSPRQTQPTFHRRAGISSTENLEYNYDNYEYVYDYENYDVDYSVGRNHVDADLNDLVEELFMGHMMTKVGMEVSQHNAHVEQDVHGSHNPFPKDFVPAFNDIAYITQEIDESQSEKASRMMKDQRIRKIGHTLRNGRAMQDLMTDKDVGKDLLGFILEHALWRDNSQTADIKHNKLTNMLHQPHTSLFMLSAKDELEDEHIVDIDKLTSFLSTSGGQEHSDNDESGRSHTLAQILEHSLKDKEVDSRGQSHVGKAIDPSQEIIRKIVRDALKDGGDFLQLNDGNSNDDDRSVVDVILQGELEPQDVRGIVDNTLWRHDEHCEKDGAHLAENHVIKNENKGGLKFLPPAKSTLLRPNNRRLKTKRLNIVGAKDRKGLRRPPRPTGKNRPTANLRTLRPPAQTRNRPENRKSGSVNPVINRAEGSGRQEGRIGPAEEGPRRGKDVKQSSITSQQNRTFQSVLGMSLEKFRTHKVFDCTGRNPGLYADVEMDCKRFIMCHENGRMGSFSCPAGTKFNQAHQICDWSARVKCSDPEIEDDI